MQGTEKDETLTAAEAAGARPWWRGQTFWWSDQPDLQYRVKELHNCMSTPTKAGLGDQGSCWNSNCKEHARISIDFQIQIWWGAEGQPAAPQEV